MSPGDGPEEKAGEKKPPPPPAAPPSSSGTRQTRREGPAKQNTRRMTDAASQTLAAFVSTTRRFLKKFTGAPPEVRIALPRDGDIRLFALAGEIDERLAMQAATWLLFVQAMKSDADVVLTVDSPGGSVTAGLSLIEIMQKSTCRVRTHCARQALGVASIVLAAGTRGYRTLSRSALLSLPGGPSWGEGETTKRTSPRVIAAISGTTGLAADAVEKELFGLKTLSPKLAVRYGLADAVGVPGK